MNLRQANKILRQQPPPEANPKNRIWWNRYWRASNYNNKIYNRKLRRLRKKGKEFISDDDIDKICDSLTI